MTETNGYLVKGKMYPARTVRCEQAMLEYIQELEAEKAKLRRNLDNIKVRSYELGQRELHDMALAALQEGE